MTYAAFSASNKSIQFYSYVNDSGMSWVIWIKSMCAIHHFGVSVGADESRARAAHTLYPVLPKRLPFCGEHPVWHNAPPATRRKNGGTSSGSVK